MIRKVAMHFQDFGRHWTVRLRCGHVLHLHESDHSRAVKGRFCPACPGATRAMGADLRNSIEERRRADEAGDKVFLFDFSDEPKDIA